MILTGWGRYPAIDCKIETLRDTSDISRIFELDRSLIARGNGRAYGDAALNPETTLLMKGCDRFLEFDPEAGSVECEAGMLLSDLLEIIVPHGWFPPVVPGTKFVTIGGLIAADVHGKNHHVDGSFGRHIESLRLALPDGSVVTCSHSENDELFAATIGGMGLTGIILSARFRLRPVASKFIDETIIRAPSLEALLSLFNAHHAATYTVAWIDCLARGPNFGRGVMILGEHAMPDRPFNDNKSRRKPGPRLSVPVELPISPLTRMTIGLFNEAYYRLQKPRVRRRFYDDYFFPLDIVQNWNRIYGRRGFIQYQCVIGGKDAENGLRRILELVRDVGLGSFLAVLKKLGPGNRYLSFPMNGYTLAVDFPVRVATMDGLTRLDAVLSEHAGRIYLAKDARAPRNLIERGYPDIERFRELRRKIDPNRKIRSVLSERLGL
jgi:decaprenylphospho-beta-D-ribofuranose 2-oxidase